MSSEGMALSLAVWPRDERLGRGRAMDHFSTPLGRRKEGFYLVSELRFWEGVSWQPEFHASVPASHWRDVSMQRTVVTRSGLFHVCLAGYSQRDARSPAQWFRLWAAAQQSAGGEAPQPVPRYQDS